MKKRNNKRSSIWLLIPVLGIVLFVCLYIVATFYYPGGSQVDEHARGFSWMQNYWCNLLNERAINGHPNTARPIATIAMAILCISLAVFWYHFPQQVSLSKSHKRLIQIFGLLSMATILLLSTNHHDLIINLATVFGLIAVVGTFVALNKLKWAVLFQAGLINIALVALNNILYYGNGLQFYLPVVQKITFLYFLIWISAINLKLLKTMRQLQQI